VNVEKVPTSRIADDAGSVGTAVQQSIETGAAGLPIDHRLQPLAPAASQEFGSFGP
jgi:hypothetical protein